MNIYLVRHGQSTANVDASVYLTTADHAVPLSELGREQAREAGRFLNDYFTAKNHPKSHARLWTSPYLRTRQTADGIEDTCGEFIADRREDILLCEQQFGLFDGIADKDLPALFPEEYAHYEKCQRHEGRFWARMPLGESRFDVALRRHGKEVTAAFETTRREMPDASTLFTFEISPRTGSFAKEDRLDVTSCVVCRGCHTHRIEVTEPTRLLHIVLEFDFAAPVSRVTLHRRSLESHATEDRALEVVERDGTRVAEYFALFASFGDVFTLSWRSDAERKHASTQ